MSVNKITVFVHTRTPQGAIYGEEWLVNAEQHTKTDAHSLPNQIFSSFALFCMVAMKDKTQRNLPKHNYFRTSEMLLFLVKCCVFFYVVLLSDLLYFSEMLSCFVKCRVF